MRIDNDASVPDQCSAPFDHSLVRVDRDRKSWVQSSNLGCCGDRWPKPPLFGLLGFICGFERCVKCGSWFQVLLGKPSNTPPLVRRHNRPDVLRKASLEECRIGKAELRDQAEQTNEEQEPFEDH